MAFQAGLIVLFGGIIFMFAGIVDFPGIVSEEDPLFGLIVFGPQVIHGALFLGANAMLAVFEQSGNGFCPETGRIAGFTDKRRKNQVAGIKLVDPALIGADP